MKILLGIVFAIITLQWWPSIPDVTFLVVAVLILALFRQYISAYIMGIAVGCLLASSAAIWFQHKSNSAVSVTSDVIIAGKVESLFIPEKKQTRVLFDIDTVNGQKLSALNRFTAILYWRTPQAVKQGQRWQLTARFREPYGRLNESGFDAETYYLSHHIHSKGSVLTATLLENIPTVRQRLVERVYADIRTLPHARFLMALAFGDRALLTPDDWISLQNTGLSHLLAISGLHIGLAFLFGFTLSRFLRPLFSAKDSALYWPFIFGLTCAFGYAWAAGFSLTAQRAFIALLVFTLIRVQGFTVSPFAAFLLVLSAVLSLDPFSVFSASFWLSFGAVLILCAMTFLSGTVFDSESVINHESAKPDRKPLDIRAADKIKGYFILLLKMQCFLIIGMLPIMSVWFNGVSLNAIGFNLLAIPLISFVTVPLILLALICSIFIDHNVFWIWADWSLLPLFIVLNQANASELEANWLSLTAISLPFLMVLVVFAFICVIIKVRQFPIFVGIVTISLLFWQAEKVDPTAWRVDVLDIGHGLAVIIERDGEAILYDTGSAWSANNTVAESVIGPILRQRGLVLSGLIISHSDNDHAGGLAWVKTNLSPIWVRTSKIDMHQTCERGTSWTWKNLRFDVLFPPKRVPDPENEDSCVVRIFDGKNALLLTGDLPKAQEIWLVNEGEMLQSDVLVVPHHGSKGSSSNAFLDAVMPVVAIASTGRYTPWKLPHPEAVKRYKSRHIKWYETGRDGQISVHFSSAGWEVVSQRLDREPFWYRKVFGRPIRKE